MSRVQAGVGPSSLFLPREIRSLPFHMNGPTATGQHRAEDCTLYQTPGAHRHDISGRGGPGSTRSSSAGYPVAR